MSMKNRCRTKLPKDGSEELSAPTAFCQQPVSRKTMSEDIEEKVAEQNVYEKSLPDEAAEKWVRRAFATDRLFAATGLKKNDVGRDRRKSGRAKCL